MEKNFNKEKEFFKGILWFSIYIFLPSIISSFLGTFLPTNNAVTKTIFLLICQLLICLVFFFIFRKTLKEDFQDLKKNHRSIINAAVKYWICGLLVMMAANLVINLIVNPGGLAVNEEMNRQFLKETPVYTILAIVAFAPFVEELIFRAGFKKAFTKIIPYSIFCGLAFGLIHVSSAFDTFTLAEMAANWKEFLYIIPYGALGFAFGYAYFKTDNIYSTMIAHCLHNTFSLALILISMLLTALGVA